MAQKQKISLPGDSRLRARVKLYGNILGEVIQEQASKTVYTAVEMLRKGFAGLNKKYSPAKHQTLLRFINKLDLKILEQLIHAFSVYFSLINVAEDCQRLQQAQGAVKKTAYEELLKQLAAENFDEKQLNALFSHLLLYPVFTAHPTEAKRRTIMQHLHRILTTTLALEHGGQNREQKKTAGAATEKRNTNLVENRRSQAQQTDCRIRSGQRPVLFQKLIVLRHPQTLSPA